MIIAAALMQNGEVSVGIYAHEQIPWPEDPAPLFDVPVQLEALLGEGAGNATASLEFAVPNGSPAATVHNVVWSARRGVITGALPGPPPFLWNPHIGVAARFSTAAAEGDWPETFLHLLRYIAVPPAPQGQG